MAPWAHLALWGPSGFLPKVTGRTGLFRGLLRGRQCDGEGQLDVVSWFQTPVGRLLGRLGGLRRSCDGNWG